MQTFARVGLCALVLLLLPSIASAQATRTWVSGLGQDANSCARNAPCLTFSGAHSKTAAGGEINCLDSGGFGAVTITKSITIKCDGVIGSVVNPGFTAITINAGSADSIHLSGLDIQGISGGTRGVYIQNAGSVQIERSVIVRSGTGIQVSSTSPVSVTISDVTIAKGSGAAVSVAAPGGAKVVMDRVRMVDNQAGVRLDATATTAGLAAIMTNSLVSNSATTGVSATTAGGRASTIMVRRSTISANARALETSGAGAVVRVGDSIVSGNAELSLVQTGAAIASYGTNKVEDNGAGALGAATLR